MSSKNMIYTVTDKNEEFFSFETKTLIPTIFDYSYVKKTLKFVDGISISSDKGNKNPVSSISELRELTEEYINYIFAMDMSRAAYTNFDFLAPFREQIQTRLLVNQLIFDVLYDKFRANSPKMTLNYYCNNFIDVDYEIYKYFKFSDCNVTFRLFLECYKHVCLTTESHAEFKEVEDAATVADLIFKDIKSKAQNEGMLIEDFNKAHKVLKECLFDLLYSFTKNKRKSILKNIHELVREEIKREINIMNNPAIRDQTSQRGFEPDLYFEYFSSLNEPLQDNIKKPKCVWDYNYYNANPNLITSKQYRRTFRRDSNASYTRFAQEFDYYDNFVQKTFGVEGADSKRYYEQSMNYYHLEKYKKLDFIYRLAVKMAANESLRDELSSVGNEHFLVTRFIPEVCCPYDYNGELCKCMKNNYYPPLIFIDELFQEQGWFQHQKYFDIWYKHNLIRAKVYELLRYHNTFILDDYLDDYDDIADFIRKDYNILAYHDTNKVWGNIGEKVTKEQKELIRNIITVNDTLFWKSEDRTPVAWENPRKTECE